MNLRLRVQRSGTQLIQQLLIIQDIGVLTFFLNKNNLLAMYIWIYNHLDLIWCYTVLCFILFTVILNVLVIWLRLSRHTSLRLPDFSFFLQIVVVIDSGLKYLLKTWCYRYYFAYFFLLVCVCVVVKLPVNYFFCWRKYKLKIEIENWICIKSWKKLFLLYNITWKWIDSCIWSIGALEHLTRAELPEPPESDSKSCGME